MAPVQKRAPAALFPPFSAQTLRPPPSAFHEVVEVALAYNTRAAFDTLAFYDAALGAKLFAHVCTHVARNAQKAVLRNLPVSPSLSAAVTEAPAFERAKMASALPVSRTQEKSFIIKVDQVASSENIDPLKVGPSSY